MHDVIKTLIMYYRAGERDKDRLVSWTRIRPFLDAWFPRCRNRNTRGAAVASYSSKSPCSRSRT